MTDLKRIAYDVAGGQTISLAEAGSGPAVIFVHGSGPGASGVSNFRQNIEAFVAAGFRVVLPDLIGYGVSSKPTGLDYTLALFTDTLMEALARHGIERASFVGNSLGGAVAIQAALDHPASVDRLVLMAPGAVAEQSTYFAMPGIAKMVSGFGGPDFNLDEQRRLIANLVHPDFAPRIPDVLVAERFAVARTQPKDVLARMRTPDLGVRLHEIESPIFLMWGVDDEFCPEAHSRLFLERCRDIRALSFARTGHWVQVERATEFNRYAIAFLQDGC